MSVRRTTSHATGPRARAGRSRRLDGGGALPRVTLAAVVLAVLASGACAPPREEVPFRIAVVGGDPFRGADATLVRLTRADGTTIWSSRHAPTERALALGPLPFATEMTLVVETVLGDLPLAGGRSFPFSVPGPGAPPTASPDVTLGLLGRHATVATLATGARVRAIAPTASGALLATDDALVPFLAHGADGRPALGTPRSIPAARVGASLAPLDGGLVAIGGTESGATLFASDGSIVAELAGPGLETGAALAALGPDAVLVVGGRDASGAAVAEVSRVERTSDGLALVPLEPLARARRDARALRVEVTGTLGRAARVLVVDGTTALGPADDILILDPDGAEPARAWTPSPVVRGAAVAELQAGQVVFAGGRDGSSAVVSDVRILIIYADRDPRFASPAPDPGLFRAREQATAVVHAPGAALILGGRDAAGAPIADTELADLRVLPGSVRLTGSLARAPDAVAAAMLGDGSILVAADETVSLYFPYPL